MAETVTYRCADCGHVGFSEDEVDLLRRSPVDKGYLACLDCIQQHQDRAKMDALVQEPWVQDMFHDEVKRQDQRWLQERMRKAERKAQDFDHEYLPPEPHYPTEQQPVTFTAWLVYWFAYFFTDFPG